MPFCPQCGQPHPDDATFCPWCGRQLDPTAPATQQIEGKVSDVFGRTLRRVVQRPGWAQLGINVAAGAVWLAVLIAAFFASAEAVFGTVHLHRIVNTHCIVRVHRVGGQGDTFKLRDNCELWRIHPGLGKPLLTGIVVAAVLIVIGTALWIVVSRATDRRFGSLRQWSVLPGGRTILRSAGRVTGWGLVIVFAWLAGGFAIGLALALLAAAGGTVGVLIGLAGLAYLLIWWIVPLTVRADMAFTRMVIDDARFPDCWAAVRPRLGQVWAYVGLMVLVGIGFGIVARILGSAGSPGTVLSAAINAAAFTVETAVTVAVMRFLAGELGSGEPPAVPEPVYGPAGDPPAPA